MKRHTVSLIRWLLLPALAGTLASAAPADNNAPSARSLGEFLAHHGYGAAAIDITDPGNQFLKAQINGNDVFLALCSGFKTSLTNHRARAFRLDIHDTGQKSWALAGPCKDDSGVAVVNSFTVNACPINRINTVDVLSKGFKLPFNDGMFGYDFLHFNAAILPVGGKVLFFKPGNGPPLSIEPMMRAMGYQPVPLTYGDQGLKVVGRLNGHPFTAQVSSSFIASMFDCGFLKASGQPTYDSNRYVLNDRAEKLPVSRFRPTQLQFGSITIDPLEVGACDSPFLAYLGCDAILGKDILSQRQAVIDFGSNILWLK